MAVEGETKPLQLKKTILNLIQVALGTFIMAIGISAFLVPNQLSTGGFSGIGTILYYKFGISVGTTILVLNIPLFILSRIKLGRQFVINAIIGTVLFSVFLNICEKIEPITDDRFLAFLYGSIINGIGTAIILKAQASTGGTDLLASIIKKYKPQLKAGSIMVSFDAIIIATNAIVFKDAEIGLYSALVIYVMGKILDIFFEGINFTKVLLIISPKWEQIAERIDKEVQRGSTALYGEGTYKKEEGRILLSAMSRNEINQARKIVREIDPNAFLIITNAREVFGEGFKEA